MPRYEGTILSDIDIASRENAGHKAVISQKQHISYHDFRILSDALAIHLLTAHSLKAGTRLAVFLEYNELLPIVIIGLLKAGMVYVPISRIHPQERSLYIINDSKCQVVLNTYATTEYVDDVVGKDFPVINMTMDFVKSLVYENCGTIGSLKTSAFPKIMPSDLAYIMYTSGSTGYPKGVMIDHSNLKYYIDSFNSDIHSKTESILPLTSSLGFAASIAQLYSPLVRGDELHVLKEDILKDPRALLDWHCCFSNTALYCVPTIWEIILDYASESTKDFPIDTVYLSGEPLKEELKTRTFENKKTIRLFNLFGPTETTANISWGELFFESPVNIGRPISGSEVLILDESNNVLAEGETGEIAACGPGVAKGYWQKEEVTHQSFTHLADGRRVYKLGDIGRYNDVGILECLGRKDRQIKVNGIRISIEEIERYVAYYKDIYKVAVAQVVSGNKKCLTAFLGTHNQKFEVGKLIQHLKEYLPTAAVPTHYITLDDFPLLSNGKLDIPSLIKRYAGRGLEYRHSVSSEYSSAKTELEKNIISIWEEKLGRPHIGLDDNFFELGGNSLQILEVVHACSSVLGYRVDFSCFQSNPTPRKIAHLIESRDIQHSDVEPGNIPLAKYGIISSQQKYFILLQSVIDSRRPYDINFIITVPEEVAIELLLQSLHTLVSHNSILEQRLNDDFELEPCPAVIRQIGSLELPTGRLEQADVFDRVIRAQDVKNDVDALARFYVVKSADGAWRILGAVNHILFDNGSIAAFAYQLDGILGLPYDGQQAFLNENIPSLYDQYAKNQQSRRSTEWLDTSVAFWKKQLAFYRETGAIAGVVDYSEPEVGLSTYAVIGERKYIQLKQLARRANVTLSNLILAFFIKTLSYYKETTKRVIGIPLSDRFLHGERQTIGCFVNMAPYYYAITEEIKDLSIITLSQHCQSVLLPLLSYQDFSYNEILNQLRNASDKDYYIFNIGYNFLAGIDVSSFENNRLIGCEEVVNLYTRLGLYLEVEESVSNLCCYFNYNTDMFSTELVNHIQSKFVGVIDDELNILLEETYHE